jgi:hypothetical protein
LFINESVTVIIFTVIANLNWSKGTLRWQILSWQRTRDQTRILVVVGLLWWVGKSAIAPGHTYTVNISPTKPSTLSREPHKTLPFATIRIFRIYLRITVIIYSIITNFAS